MSISTKGQSHTCKDLSCLLTYFASNRAGELNSDELERLVTIIQNPTQFKIPTWFLNRQRDIVDGKNSQILSNGVDSKLRDDLERLKKIRAHRGLRHFWGLRVRGQHTKTTGSCPFLFFVFPPLQRHLLLMNDKHRSSWKDRRCVQEAWLNNPLLHITVLPVYLQLSFSAMQYASCYVFIIMLWEYICSVHISIAL